MDKTIVILKRILLSVFPPPKQRVTAGAVLPLAVFLAVFGGACLYLEFSHKLLFARPGAFGLLAAAVWLWWLHFAGYAGLGRVRSLVALELRLVLAGLFVILLAE